MTFRSCCIVNCKNTSSNSSAKFFRFPGSIRYEDRRRKWITAIKRINDDGTPWIPKQHHAVCSDHFVGGKPSNDPLSPAYSPTLLPEIYKKKKVNEQCTLKRHERFIHRRMKLLNKEIGKGNSLAKHEPIVEITVGGELSNNIQENNIPPDPDPPSCVDQYCQVEIFETVNRQPPMLTNLLVCNRVIYSDSSIGDAEIQTNIRLESFVIYRRKKNKAVNTEKISVYCG